tara:strand:+ start:71 stop:508 length:438 start_codon:yes stop_codon:yes gene_type:complete
MGKVLEIGIVINKGGQIKNVSRVKAIKGKGLFNDRKFKENNDIRKQITLIEIEHIKYFNSISKSNIKPIDFRRNIITEDIKLNDIIGKEFSVGSVNLKAHDLCRPCIYLQEKLRKNNFIKEFQYKGGLRCEILTSGEIKVGDIIK